MALTITPKAATKLKDVLAEQGDTESSLRIVAIPGNNGGLQYMLSMEKDVQEDDTILDHTGLKVLVDSFSAPFLDEATIDYVEEITHTGFVISNPKFSAAGGCACGGGGCGSGGACGGGGGACACGGHGEASACACGGEHAEHEEHASHAGHAH